MKFQGETLSSNACIVQSGCITPLYVLPNLDFRSPIALIPAHAAFDPVQIVVAWTQSGELIVKQWADHEATGTFQW
jgi:hypothetical protein